ncbi:hypothetical protein OH77DRAFT_1057027 [Trametes cingulata]|nr:hypothetical protein OH77DRAFT_1057027 [Trametes cingulata]
MALRKKKKNISPLRTTCPARTDATTGYPPPSVAPLPTSPSSTESSPDSGLGASSHSITVPPPSDASRSEATRPSSCRADGTTGTAAGSATSGALTLPLGSSASPTQTALADAGTGSGAQQKSIPVVAIAVPVVVCLGGAAVALYLWTRRRRCRRHMRAQGYPHASPQPGSSRSPSQHEPSMTEASVHSSAPLVTIRRSVTTSDTTEDGDGSTSLFAASRRAEDGDAPDHVPRVHCAGVPAVRRETSKQRLAEFSREPRIVPTASHTVGESPPGIPEPEEPPPYNPSAAVVPHPSPSADHADAHQLAPETREGEQVVQLTVPWSLGQQVLALLARTTRRQTEHSADDGGELESPPAYEPGLRSRSRGGA